MKKIKKEQVKQFKIVDELKVSDLINNYKKDKVYTRQQFLQREDNTFICYSLYFDFECRYEVGEDPFIVKNLIIDTPMEFKDSIYSYHEVASHNEEVFGKVFYTLIIIKTKNEFIKKNM